MYAYVVVYTSMYIHDIFIIQFMWVQPSIYLYILVCTSTYQYILFVSCHCPVCTGTYLCIPVQTGTCFTSPMASRQCHDMIQGSTCCNVLSMEKHAIVRCWIYRLVPPCPGIQREMAIYCHKTCINCYHASSYQFYWHSMGISLRILYTWTWRYKSVYPAMYYGMPFHAMVHCCMYSLVSCCGTVYLPRAMWSM